MPAIKFDQTTFETFLLENPETNGNDFLPVELRPFFQDPNSRDTNRWLLQFYFVHKDNEDAGDNFWQSFKDLSGAIGLERLKFYYTYHRLGRLVEWVKLGHLTIPQVIEYDALKSYERKPKEMPNADDATIETVPFDAAHSDQTKDDSSDSDSSTNNGMTVAETTIVESFQPISAVNETEQPLPEEPFLYSYPYGKKPLGFEFTAEDSEHYMHSVSRKLPHLLANDAYQDDETPPLTPKERARYDMEAENPRLHASRRMVFHTYSITTDARDYLCLRYYEEYLNDFFDHVILFMAEERIRLLDELKTIHTKIALFGEIEVGDNLAKQCNLLEEKIDLLSGCIKQQCWELKKAVVEIGNTRVTGMTSPRYLGTPPCNSYSVGLAPLKVYQRCTAPGEEHIYVTKCGIDLLCDKHYRTERVEKCSVDGVNVNTLNQKARQLDKFSLEKHQKSTLPQWRNPLAAFFKALLGIAVGLATAALLLPVMAIELAGEKYMSLYPRIWNDFNGTFFRSRSHQSSFEAEKKQEEALRVYARKAYQAYDTATALRQSGFYDKASHYRKDFSQWQEGKHEELAPLPNLRRQS